MTRQGRFHTDLPGLIIPDLADHNDIRVLPKKSLQRSGKCQPDVGMDLHLVDAHEVELNGVFRRTDIDSGRVESLKGGVERRRLAAACRAGDEDHAIWCRKSSFQIIPLLLF